MAGKRGTSALRKEPAAGAVVVPFPARGHAGVLPPVPAQRPAIPAIERGSFGLALALSLALHASIFAALQSWTESDLERALGNAATPAAEGTVVLIPIEIVADSALPSAAVPTNTTTPDAQTPNTVEVAEPEKPKPEPQAVVEPTPSLPPPPVAEAPSAEPMVAPPDPKASDWRMVEEKPDDQPKQPETPKVMEPQPKPKEVRRAEPKPAAPSVAASPARPAASATTAGPAGNRGNIETGGTALLSSYRALVSAHLQRFRTYPEEARSRGITGVAAVRFALGRDGRVLSVSLVSSSGATILDQAALAIVRRASPFPPFPSGLNRTQMEFGQPLRFDLR